MYKINYQIIRFFSEYTTGSNTPYSRFQNSLNQIKECSILSNKSTHSSKHSLIVVCSCTKKPLILNISTTFVTPTQLVLNLNK